MSTSKSLRSQGHPLSLIEDQRKVLRPTDEFLDFDSSLEASGHFPLTSFEIDVLQINLGKLCNQTCKHCHVDAGPDRTEVMDRVTMQECLRFLQNTRIPRVDLTGGAPEMNPDFRWLVEQCCAMGRHVMDRCNLTILNHGRFRDLPDFLAEHGVEIIASLPHFSARSTNAQRGDGVFESSLLAIKRLNAIGYGQEGSGRILNLVYNPTGAFLAPQQASIEPEYRRQLLDGHGVVFNDLFVLNNMPINRFLEFLLRTEQFDEYMRQLVNAFNPTAAGSVMCRSMISVGWDGRLYDCDFNQMLEIPLTSGCPQHVAELTMASVAARRISTGLHCYGCTAGSGSSCGGAIVR